MIKFKVNNGERLISSLNKIFNDLKKSEIMTKQIAEYTFNRVQAFTRSGKSLPNNAKLPRLSDRYMQYRTRLKKRAEIGKIYKITPDSDFFRPRIANNTLTGQLMRSLFYRVSETGVVTLSVKGRRDDGKTNQEVAEALKEKGREFLGMDDLGIKQIKTIVLREFRRSLRRK